jgi:hypothetical protein
LSFDPRLSRTPLACEYCPVISVARLGAQSEFVTNMLVNRTPSRAMRSMFGVLRNGWPAQDMKSNRWSSVIMTTTLGLSVASAGTVVSATAANVRSVRIGGLRGEEKYPGVYRGRSRTVSRSERADRTRP